MTRLTAQKASLPGWVWGTLGCLSVLGVGSAALLIAAKSGALGGGSASVAAAKLAPLPVALPPAPPKPAPQIEPLAVPAPPVAERSRSTHHSRSSHAIKVAREQSEAKRAAPAKDDKAVVAAAAPVDNPPVDNAAAPVDKPAATATAPAPTDKPAAPPAVKTSAPTADDQVVHLHRPTASDQDDDDDDSGD